MCVIVPNEARENKNTTVKKERERENMRELVWKIKGEVGKGRKTLYVCVCVEPNEHKRSVLGGRRIY